jgi:hypothetical protein
MKKLTIASLIALCAFCVVHARAQIIHVPGDYTTIQAAVDAANYGDTVLVDQGRYFENVIIQGNAKSITLASNYIFTTDSADIINTVIDASQPQNPNYGMGVLLKNIDTTLMPKICGFTITGGTGYYMTYGGGIHSTGAIPVIEHNIIDECSLSSGMQPSGAGIRVGPGIWDTTKVCIIRNNIVKNCTINCVSNAIEAVGAGISLGGISSIIEENKVLNNTITGTSTAYANGAGIFYYMWINSFHPEVVIKNNEVINNIIESWDASGGGILLSDEFGMTEYMVEGNLISGNKCISIGSNGDAKGGGIYLYNPAVSSVISHNIISGNNALVGPPGSQPFGGGIYMEGIYPQAPENNVTLEKNRITGNTAYYGGGMICVTTGVNMINNFISENQAVMYGGAIYFNGSADTGMVARFINNTITSNSVSGQGGQAGGMMIDGDMKVLLFNDLFYGNQAETSDELKINTNNLVVVQNCDINTDEITGTWTGENNFFADPQFIDEMTWDCFNHEAPCSDAGADELYAFGEWFEAPADCIMGNARPQDEFVDVGACEVKMCWVGVPDGVGSQHSAFSIYPNPTTGKFQITSTKFQTNYNKQITNRTIEIVDFLGNVVFILNQEPGIRNPELDISDLPSGIYFIRINVDNEMITGKIIKL